MKGEELFRILGEVDEELVLDASVDKVKKHKRFSSWNKYGVLAASLAVIMLAGGVYSIARWRGNESQGGTSTEMVDPSTGKSGVEESINSSSAKDSNINNENQNTNDNSGEQTASNTSTLANLDMSQEVGIEQLDVQKYWPKYLLIQADLKPDTSSTASLKLPVYRKYEDLRGDKLTINSNPTTSVEGTVTDDPNEEMQQSTSERMKQKLIEIGKKLGVSVEESEITDVKPVGDSTATLNGKQLTTPIKDKIFQVGQYYWTNEDYLLSISQLSKQSNNFQCQIILKNTNNEIPITGDLLEQLKNDEAYETAQYVCDNNEKLLMLDNPTPTTSIREQETTWIISCYNKASTIEQNLFNYSCERTDVYIDATGNLKQIDVLMMDTSNKLGDYELADMDEVKNMVEDGICYNPSGEDVNQVIYDQNVEIWYLPSIDTAYLMPYYKLHIGGDEENYYIFVPAVKQKYLTDYTTWIEQIK